MTVLNRAIAYANKSYEVRHSEAQQRALVASQAATRFAAVLAAASNDLFGEVQAHHQMRSEGEVLVLSLAINGSDAAAVEVAQVMQAAGGVLADAELSLPAAVALSAFELDEDAERLLREVAGRALEQVEYRRRHAADREAARRPLQTELEAALPPAR